MRLISSAFAPNERIPARFTCDGANVSPTLSWLDPPRGTRSFALVCSDPDAPAGVWYHWAVYDIPATMRGLPEGLALHGPGPLQAVNDFRRSGYGGPCPPRGARPHHYHFRLFALDVARLALRTNPGCRDVEAASEPHAITMAELIGVYGRPVR